MKNYLSLIITLWFVQTSLAQTILMNNNNPETIVCGNTYNFYDAGGPSGPYSFGYDATYIKTFTPSSPGQKVRIDFSTFDVENYYTVYVEIFDGPNVNSPSLGQYSGSNSPGTVISTANGGELTVLFTHDLYQLGYQGWIATITCTSPLTPPVNDSPCGATLLNVSLANPVYQLGSLIGATNSTDNLYIFNPPCANYNNGPDVWYKAVVPASGNLAFITNDSTIYDTGIELYKGSSCQNLIPLSNSCNDDGNNNSAFGTMSKLELNSTPGDTIFLRVWKKNGGMGLFRVAAYEPIPSIEVLYPNGGETLLQNDYIYIDVATTAVDTITIEFSSDSGLTWNHIVNWPISNGSFVWTVPNISSTQCLIRVSQMGNSSLFDISDATFTISGPFIQVTQPNGGEIYLSGQQGVEIYWNSPGFYGNVNVLFSNNNGNTWIPLDTNIYNNGYSVVDFPSVVSTQCLIKIEDANNSNFFDVSNATFTLTNNPPTITILNPIGGEIYTVGQAVNIAWSAQGVSFVDIYYNFGYYDILIASNVPANQNAYTWFINNNIFPGTYAIKISPAGSPWLGVLSNSFTIQSASPSISLSYPYGSETFYAGSYHTISWQSSQINQHKIELSTNGQNGPWTTIANNVVGQSYYWLVPNTPSYNNCYIRISDANNPLIYSQNFYPFTIDTITNSNTIATIYNGNLSICPGDNFNVDYTSNGTFYFNNTYTVQLSDANGSFANPIPVGFEQSNSNSGTIPCTMPSNIPAGNGYKVRVVSNELPAVGTPISGNITVNPSNAEFTASPTVAYLPINGQINFSLVGSNAGIASYNWNFGDGGTATTQNPSHTYTSQGFYNISLTTINSNGCSATVVKPLYITIEYLFDTDTILTFTTQDILGLAFSNPATGCFALANGNCLITQDSGLTFTNVPTGLTTPLTSASLVNGFWLVTSIGGNVAISTNGGITWSVQNVGTTDTLFASAFLNNNNGYVVGHNGVIFKYNGSNWIPEGSGTLSSLRGVSFADTDVIAVGYGGVILRSTGNGIWGPRTSPFNSNYRAVAFNDAGIGIIVGDLGRIVKSSNNGLTWSPALSGVPANFTSVAISGDSIWAVANGGIIYKSFDAGNTWIRNSLGVLNDLNGITFYGDEQLRRMGLDENQRAQNSTRGYVVGDGGVARMFGNPIDTTGNNTDIIKLLDFKVLFNVYPVPAINEITIEGTLKQEGLLNITLKDMYGATIKVINAQKENGKIVKRISVADLASGIYFVHIDSPEQQSVHRIVVSK
jgi:PKD repeat protein